MVLPVLLLTNFTTVFNFLASTLDFHLLELPAEFASIVDTDLIYPFLLLEFDDECEFFIRNLQISDNL